MIVRQLKVGTMDNFVYLLEDESSKQAMVVDSGWETEPLESVAKALGATVKYVVATHHHFDHVNTMGQVARATGAATVAHESSPLSTDVRVSDGTELKLGESVVSVIHTPGHTEDSICLYDGADLFTGDTLFIGTFGRTDLPGGSARKLFKSIHEAIMTLPGGTVIYSGHDYGDVPYRSLDEESKLNPALLARDVESFIELAG